MEEVNGIFCGFKRFLSKKNDKEYFVLSFLFIDEDQLNQKATYFVQDIFVTEKEYNQFISSFELVGEVILKRQIVGNKVVYSL